MCGIVGYVGDREAAPILMGGLRHLEYRGYDSAGLAVANGGPASVVRARGKLANLQSRLAESGLHGTIGIGHTRWATHGVPSVENAHPHKVGSISVVHNGIIENYIDLRRRLEATGRHFSSQTDTEVVAHLIHEALAAGAPNLLEALRQAVAQVRGTYALVVLSDDDKQRVVAAKKGSPLVVGLGDGEMFVASDVPAILEHTRKVVFLEDGELADLTRNSVRLSTLDGTPVTRAPQTVVWETAQAEKNGYPHFMLKEIHEQPRAVADTLRGRLLVDQGDANLDGFVIDPAEVRRVVLLACGTSYHAGLIGKFMIEGTARIPCEVDVASEFRYRDAVVGPGDLVIAISQSGETADTLAAVKEARAQGARVLAISNVVGSAIPRAADGALYTRAGLEIGVASTKAFTAQLAALALVAVHMGRRARPNGAGLGGPAAAAALATALARIPTDMETTLAGLADLDAVTARFVGVRDVLFLGRGTNFPIALEGALKLKEISYIHAEGYAAGEMKHGPIALIDDGLPVVVVAPQGPSYEKVMSNLAEVRARQALIIAVATIGDRQIEEQCANVLWVPDAPPLLQPLLTVLPLQLLSYAVALARGNDVDQPRNLAKSVTVE